MKYRSYFTKAFAMSRRRRILIIDTETGGILHSGSLYQIAHLTGCKPPQVVGFAEWGQPTKKLDGYFLKWERV
jgi:hypothetical protein